MMRTFFAVAVAAAMTAIALPVSAAFGGAGGAVTVAQYDSSMPLLQASSWNVTEDGGWTGVWTFNGNRRSMNAVWTNQSTGMRVTGRNLRVSQNGQQIIVRRPGLGNYVGTVNSAGTAMSGTMSWNGGHFSARIGNGGGYNPGNGNNGGGYNGGGYNGGGNAPMLNANRWSVTEDGGWSAIWTFTGTRTMSGVWTNNQTGERVRVNNMAVRQNGNQIIVERPGLGNYVGTVNSNGTAMSGTMSWSSGHFSARIANGGGYNPGNGNNGGGYNGGGNNGGGNAPMLNANRWSVTEDGGWSAIWTFTGPRTMSGVWTNNQTGERVRVNDMTVRQDGNQIIVERPGLGNYVGTLSGDGNSMSGTLSWSGGRFNARIQN